MCNCYSDSCWHVVEDEAAFGLCEYCEYPLNPAGICDVCDPYYGVFATFEIIDGIVREVRE